MEFLDRLNIPHTAAQGPAGTLIVFPHVANQRLAYTYLLGAGYPVEAREGRALFIAAPAPLRYRDRHTVAYRVLVWSALLIILPAPYISVPVYGYLGIRWYVRRNGKPRALRPGNGKRRADTSPRGLYAGSPNIPWYRTH